MLAGVVERQRSDQGILSDGVAVGGAVRAALRRCAANVTHGKGAGPDICRAILTRVAGVLTGADVRTVPGADRHGAVRAAGARSRGGRCAGAGRSLGRAGLEPGRAALGRLATALGPGERSPLRARPGCSGTSSSAVVVRGRAWKSRVEIPEALACARDARLRAHRVETRPAGISTTEISSTENWPVRPGPRRPASGQGGGLGGCSGSQRLLRRDRIGRCGRRCLGWVTGCAVARLPLAPSARGRVRVACLCPGPGLSPAHGSAEPVEARSGGLEATLAVARSEFFPGGNFLGGCCSRRVSTRCARTRGGPGIPLRWHPPWPWPWP